MKLTIALCLIFYSISSNACECPPYAKLNKSYTQLFDVIFYGTVDSTVKNQIIFSVETLFKGNVSNKITLRSADTVHCSMAFNKGEKWLIYGEYKKYSDLTVDFCSRSRRYIQENDFYTATLLSSFSDDLHYLETELGAIPFTEAKKNEPYTRTLLHPDSWSTLWLVVFSTVGLCLVYFVVRKYL